ncbi:MAG: hypothetical protein K2K40_09795 [Paramuribaculum sp.]|nr:hypothetical protein [Candidatus Amulumruptor sp.]MDE6588613.1 hypothetical protein [Paramuribaculum sp.]
MTPNIKTIQDMGAGVDRSLATRRLASALTSLAAMAEAASMPFAMRSRISSLADNYAMLRRYFIDGVTDPERDRIASDITAEAAAIRCAIERRVMTDSDNPNLYFSTLRFEQTRPDETVAALLGRYEEAAANSAERIKAEALATRLFNRVWVTFPLSSDDADALHHRLAAPVALEGDTDPLRRLLVGALMLGSLRYFDSRRAILLADIYRINPSTPVGAVALTALILALASAPAHALGGRKLRAALDALADIPSLAADARMAFMQLIRSRDTDRVSRKMTDEIFPGIMKMRPDIDRKMRDLQSRESNPFDEEGGLNPEWEELLDRSGLSDKLRELNEMQTEGADVMMASMANLKDFPFFNDPANWFLPFYAGHSSASDSNAAAMARALEALPMMCDGDKYSLLFFSARMGGTAAGSGLAAHMEEQQRQLSELMSAELDADSKAREHAVNSFVQSIYRFFKLFRRKGEFTDPFVKPVNPLLTPVLDRVFGSDSDALAVPAEFYFRRGYYAEALTLFERMEELMPPTAELYQKKGYALEQTGNPEEALTQYRTADLIDSDSVWTLRRMAALLRLSGHSEEALGLYDRIQTLKPDRPADIRNRADTLRELNRHSEALTLYYKADYLKPDRPAIMRPMLRCQLITGDTDKALATSRRLAASGVDLTPDDHIDRGHASIALHDYKGAIEAYADAIAALDFNSVALDRRLEADRALLTRLGADPLTVSIIIEAAIEAAASRGSKI